MKGFMSAVRMVGYFIILVLLAGVIGCAFGVIYTRQESRRLFSEYNELTKERDRLNYEFGRLELERATKAEINGIEKTARTDIGMVSPSAANTVVIKR
ncbi:MULTISPECIES: cell division protein FtsL [unclassified Rudaea]|uniref:cell division protein FtsL n=1 Tax=unclassified Rudaea TaxID=2627037 RepID=UPI00201639EB|nr:MULTISPECIES: cell division protein FtsL [unclassified Rudaea]